MAKVAKSVEATVVQSAIKVTRVVSSVRRLPEGVYSGYASLGGKRVKVHKAPRQKFWRI